MVNIKDILKESDEQLFAKLVNSAKGTCETLSDIKTFVESVDIPLYKKFALFEYADKNKDLLLSMDTHTEMEPVTASDTVAPVSTDKGKVTNGIENSPALSDEEEYEEPEKHPTRDKTQVDEHKCIAILSDGSLQKVIVEDISEVESLVEEHFNKTCIVVFEETVAESLSLYEGEMTDAQKEKREEIVLAMKKNSRELQKRYGEKWESVMYAIATKKAMEESVTESENTNVLFTTEGPDGTKINIERSGEYYVVKQYKGKEAINVQEYNDYEDAAVGLKALK